MSITLNDTSLIYAGIGSRETPPDVLQVMRRLGHDLGKRGFTLRSGAAKGADTAFEYGCDVCSGSKEIWLPWTGFDGRPPGPYTPNEIHFERASKLHPAWMHLKHGARALHARNTGQILGAQLNTPVRFVICWTQDGAQSHDEVTRSTGGTGTAIRLASLEGIPVFNLYRPDALEQLRICVKAHTV